MRRPSILAALAWAAVAAGAGCGPPGAASTPGVTPLPASPVAVQPAPGTAILDAGAAGLPLTGSEDGITAAEAANGVPDAADALPLFDSWGWVVASRRTFARGPGTSVDVTLLLLLRETGAESAFAFYSEQAAVPPLIAGPCPPTVTGVDQCAFGQSAGQGLVAGRVGLEVFEIATRGEDAARLASAQAARLR